MTAKPFLRWAGSKRKLVPKLLEYWDENKYNRYLEPFVGSAQFLFAIGKKKAVLSDINNDLIQTYRRLKADPEKIFYYLNKLPNNSETYYKLRDNPSERWNKFQKASVFIYLNKHCFNGIYRTNKDGKFNVPYAYDLKKKFPLKKDLINASDRLQNVKIKCADFESIIKAEVKNGDFIYLDPPYAVENRRIFRQYGPQTFGLEDIHRLKKLLKYINDKGAKFLLSYAYCQESIDLGESWKIRKLFIQRNIAGFSDKRKKAAELLITNI